MTVKEFDPELADELSNNKRKKKISFTTSESKHKAASQGYFLSSRAPFGYRKGNTNDPDVVDSRVLIIDKPAAEAVHQCFERYASGEWTYEMIAKSLNEQGFVTTRGKSFSRETVRIMLNNPTYLGKIVYKGNEVFEGLHDPIVEQSLWDQVKFRCAR